MCPGSWSRPADDLHCYPSLNRPRFRGQTSQLERLHEVRTRDEVRSHKIRLVYPWSRKPVDRPVEHGHPWLVWRAVGFALRLVIESALCKRTSLTVRPGNQDGRR